MFVGVFLKVLLLDEGLATLATLVLVPGDMVPLNVLPQAVDVAQREATLSASDPRRYRRCYIQ